METAARRSFLAQYAIIRHAEGRGSHDPAYYRALPWQDISGKNSAQWAIRARSYRHFERTILRDIEKQTGRALHDHQFLIFRKRRNGAA